MGLTRNIEKKNIKTNLNNIIQNYRSYKNRILITGFTGIRDYIKSVLIDLKINRGRIKILAQEKVNNTKENSSFWGPIIYLTELTKDKTIPNINKGIIILYFIDDKYNLFSYDVYKFDIFNVINLDVEQIPNQTCQNCHRNSNCYKIEKNGYDNNNLFDFLCEKCYNKIHRDLQDINVNIYKTLEQIRSKTNISNASQLFEKYGNFKLSNSLIYDFYEKTHASSKLNNNELNDLILLEQISRFNPREITCFHLDVIIKNLLLKLALIF
ncbi:MAG TPA: hypothetical protein VLB84_15840 [Bacteroidia bacterium]|nr:hypothetical protein [Bacteroidia bacterium]